MLNNLKDNIKFTYGDEDVLIFNHRTYVMLVYGILTHYLRLTASSAKNLISEGSLLNEPKSYDEACNIMHDTVYHTAMLYAYKKYYWNNGYEEKEPDDFSEWCIQYCKENDLLDEIAEFID